jgi:small-conductance mechanosensitive channel
MFQSVATSSTDLRFTGVAGPLFATFGRVALIVILTALVIAAVRLFISRIDDHRLRAQLLFFAPKVTVIIAVVVGLSSMGIDVSGMAAVLATIGFTGAVVFTPVGQNFVAGAMIRIDDIYREGEVVTVGDLHGKVVYRSLLRTEIALPDGSTAWVPNSLFQDNEVLNHSRMGGWRICVQVPLDRSSDRIVATEIMSSVMESLTWNRPGKTPFVAFDYVGSEAMFFNAYAWIDDRTLEPWYRSRLLSQLVDALEDAGVSVGQTTNLSITPPEGTPTISSTAPAVPSSPDARALPARRWRRPPSSGLKPRRRSSTGRGTETAPRKRRRGLLRTR